MSRFIVIDGLDGTGKATQAKLLENELADKGFTVHHMEWPDYSENSSWPVKEYLGGALGSDPQKLNPYMCASFYTVDRMVQYHKKNKQLFNLDDSHVIVSDRYISANVIHQGAKMRLQSEHSKFVEWCYDFEHNLCGAPLEDATIILTVPVAISQKMMSERYAGDETRKDIHERDTAYLETCSKKLEDLMCKLRDNQVRFPAPWYELQCITTKKNPKADAEDICSLYELASIDTVHRHVMAIVNPLLEGHPVKTKTYCCFFGMDQYQ